MQYDCVNARSSGSRAPAAATDRVAPRARRARAAYGMRRGVRICEHTVRVPLAPHDLARAGTPTCRTPPLRPERGR
eukprot:1472299-Prymnesium_polylepis.1